MKIILPNILKHNIKKKGRYDVLLLTTSYKFFMEYFVYSQLKSKINIFAIFSFYFFLIYLHFHYTDWYVLAFFTIFLLITGGTMIYNMIIISVLVAGILAALPFLAPIAFIIMAVLFFMRINYVITNWRPVICGIMLYATAFQLFDSPHSSMSLIYISNLLTQYLLYIPGTILNTLGIYNPYIIHLFHLLHITTPYFFTALFFQILLYWLYCNGYKSETALSIMGTIPLVIIALILPFLKVMHFDGMMGDAHTVDVTPHDNVIPPPDGYHHVNGYWRTMPNGHTEYVHSYIRSNPDGIIENNLSSGYFPHDSSITHTAMYNSEAHMPNVFLTKMYYSVTDFLTLKKPSVLSITFLGMLINCITTVILFAILL